MWNKLILTPSVKGYYCQLDIITNNLKNLNAPNTILHWTHLTCEPKPSTTEYVQSKIRTATKDTRKATAKPIKVTKFISILLLI